MRPPTIEHVTSLDEATAAAVVRLAEAAEELDGVGPLNEAALMALRHGGVAHHLVRIGGELVGYAQLDPTSYSAQLCVRPSARRQGLGRALARAVQGDSTHTSYWAFGNLPGAQRLAASFGAHSVRELLILGRELTASEELSPLPDGVELRAFRPTDEPALLAVNAAAFAHHPEQGAMDHENFTERTEQEWYDPADLLVAVDAAGGLLGFHWTKRHGDGLGEVYVIATAPEESGRGLGGALLTAGLAHLAEVGCRRVILYVESDNPALRLYRRHGFVVDRSDVVYAVPGGHSDE